MILRAFDFVYMRSYSGEVSFVQKTSVNILAKKGNKRYSISPEIFLVVDLMYTCTNNAAN